MATRGDTAWVWTPCPQLAHSHEGRPDRGTTTEPCRPGVLRTPRGALLGGSAVPNAPFLAWNRGAEGFWGQVAVLRRAPCHPRGGSGDVGSPPSGSAHPETQTPASGLKRGTVFQTVSGEVAGGCLTPLPLFKFEALRRIRHQFEESPCQSNMT